MIKQFKEFIIRGNVVDMSVGIIVGAAFGGLVQSLVKDILMPPLGLLTGGVDFTNKFAVLKSGKDGLTQFATLAEAAKSGAVTLNYGVFLTLLLNLLIVGFAVFALVRGIQRLKKPAPPPAAPTKEQELLTEIRDLMKKKED